MSRILLEPATIVIIKKKSSYNIDTLRDNNLMTEPFL